MTWFLWGLRVRVATHDRVCVAPERPQALVSVATRAPLFPWFEELPFNACTCSRRLNRRQSKREIDLCPAEEPLQSD